MTVVLVRIEHAVTLNVVVLKTAFITNWQCAMALGLLDGTCISEGSELIGLRLVNELNF